MKKFALVLSLLVVISSAHAMAMGGPPESGSHMVPTSAAASFETAPADVHVVRITAKQFEYLPKTFTVKKGSPVRIILTSADVAHGFAIDAFQINVRVEKDKDTIVDFTPDKAGTFDYYCTVFCGIGHAGMRGQMTVQ